MLANVRQTTIRPVIEASVAKGALVHTDEYDVYARLQDWGYGHKTVCHGRGEYARDEDGDGFCEVHVNTAEGFWSLLRSWLRPHRGISQEKLPAYLGFFQLVHNARRRGKALLGTLIAGLEPIPVDIQSRAHHLLLFERRRADEQAGERSRRWLASAGCAVGRDGALAAGTAAAPFGLPQPAGAGPECHGRDLLRAAHRLPVERAECDRHLLLVLGASPLPGVDAGRGVRDVLAPGPPGL
jgi:transposase